MAEGRAEFMRSKAWREAYEVGLEIYQRAAEFPSPHRFTLGSQLQRAAISMPTNLAEGFGRRRSGEKAHFYSISRASGDELKTLLLFARDLRLISPEVFDTLMSKLDRASKLAYGLIQGMDSWNDPPRKPN